MVNIGSKSIQMIENKSVISELPPIGIQPKSPSYTSKTDNSYDRFRKRVMRSPASPTSTTSSQGGSYQYITPIGTGMRKSATYSDLNGKSLNNSKLETLYEMTLSQSTSTLNMIEVKKPDGIENNGGKLHQIKTVVLPSTISNKQFNTAATPMAHSSVNDLQRAADGGKLRLCEDNLIKLHQSSSKLQKSNSSLPDTGYDTDEEKEQRIEEWLMAVENSQLEEPQEIVGITTHEKRDTAIHIVYQGD